MLNKKDLDNEISTSTETSSQSANPRLDGLRTVIKCEASEADLKAADRIPTGHCIPITGCVPPLRFHARVVKLIRYLLHCIIILSCP